MLMTKRGTRNEESGTHLPTGVAVTDTDWLLLQSYSALNDMAKAELIEMVIQIEGEPEPASICYVADLIDVLARRHGLPNLSGDGSYDIDFDTKEFIVEKEIWEKWNHG